MSTKMLSRFKFLTIGFAILGILGWLFVTIETTHAAISFVASDKAQANQAQELTVNVPSGTADDDVMLATCALDNNRSGSNWTVTEGGWTRIFNHVENEGQDKTSAIFYRVASSEPASYTFDTGLTINEQVSCIIHTYRNVDTSNVLDITFDTTEDTGHLATGTNDSTPSNRPVTTVTDDALVIVWHHATHDDITVAGAPSGYTLRDSWIGSTLDHRQQILAEKVVTTAGLESPGDWTHTCSPCTTQEYTVATLVLRPADLGAPAAVSDLAASGATTTTIDLAWTAPGDDGSTGTATSYDIRYSTSNITEGNWSSATQVTGEPTPSVAGSSESMTVTGLTESTTYYFAIKTSDEIPNESGISNVPSLSTTATPDTTAPAAVSDLAVSSPGATSVNLAWTAPGDDGSTGTATSYDVRYSTSTITEGNWSSATQAVGEPTPVAAGGSQSMTVSGLSPETTYYFAIKTSDEVPNESAISNVPSGTTVSIAEAFVPDLPGATYPAEITFSGEAYPGSTLEIKYVSHEYGRILDKVDQFTVGEDGSFSELVKANWAKDNQLYSLLLRDEEDNLLTSKFFTYDLDFNIRIRQEYIIFSPTIEVNKSTFSKAEQLVISGKGTPGNTIEVLENKKVIGTTLVTDEGTYSISFDTSSFFLGPHTIQTRQVDDISGTVGEVSELRTITIGQFAHSSVDMNDDDKVDIADWSIFLYNWSDPDQDVQLRDDLNDDGVVDVTDFSVFLTSFQSSL